MKRVLLHICFWVAYWLEDTLLVFFWITPMLVNVSQSAKPLISLQSALLYLPSKILFTYYLSYRAIPPLVRKRRLAFRDIFRILVVLFCTILLYRSISVWIVRPYVYRNPPPHPPLLHPMEVLIAIMDIGFISGLVVGIRLFKAQRSAREQEKVLVRQKLEAELQALRNQTNPHFLMNTLNNIYVLALKRSADTAGVVMKLSELLRFMLYESGGRFITLNDEINVLKSYLELERIRYNDRLSIHFGEDIDRNGYQITPLLLLPMVENAFTHGISETRFESLIRINILAKAGQMHFSISNTKGECPGNKRKTNTGLCNLKRQLELTYRDYQLEVDNGEELFTVNLSINLNSHVEI